MLTLLNAHPPLSLLRTANTDNGPKLREEFSRICFEVLLQFSLVHEEHQQEADEAPPTGNSNKITNQLAITSLLDRFQKVLATFVQDSKTSGQCPLPRSVVLIFHKSCI